MSQNGFTGYEIEQPTHLDDGWCPTGAISISWIEERALYRLENFQDCDFVFLSEDVYYELERELSNFARLTPSMNLQYNGVGLQTMQIWTTAGRLLVKKVPTLINFCHVGTESSLRRLEQMKIDKAFEEQVMDVK